MRIWIRRRAAIAAAVVFGRAAEGARPGMGAGVVKVLMSVLFHRSAEESGATLANYLAFTTNATRVVVHVSAASPIGEHARAELARTVGDLPVRVAVNPERRATAHASGSDHLEFICRK